MARSFARKGHVAGVIYRAAIDPAEVVFYDDENRWNEGGLEAEEEVVVFHRGDLEVDAREIVDRFVDVGGQTRSTQTAKRNWQERREALLARHPELYQGSARAP